MSKICNTHKMEAEWKEGVSKAGKGYAFWGCSQKLADGNFCKGPIVDGEGVNPKSINEFESSIKDERSRRIERQHSQEMALRFLDLGVRTGQINEVTRELVQQYTVHFEKDLEV